MEKIEVPIKTAWTGHITLIRHGETPSNRENRFLGITNDSLSPKGIKQAETTREVLQNLDLPEPPKFDAIFSSPLNRCLETAEIINEAFNLPLYPTELLKERNYGIFEGKTHKEVEENLPELFKKYSENKPFVLLPEGESALHVESRVYEFLTQELVEQHSDVNDILIVSHLNPIRATLRFFGFADWEIYFEKISNTAVIRLAISQTEIKKIYECGLSL